MNEKPFDIIIFGATSFVGAITARYMAEHFGVGGEVKWAIAGRSQSKLDALNTELQDVTQSPLPTIVAEAHDEPTLKEMCLQGRVIISTVGPYDLYGESLVKVCVETGTDYCDLTGEIQFYKRMLDKYESASKVTGARILHCCGFDSIPSDLGVFFIQEKAMETFGEPCESIDMRVKRIKGKFSGGTYASMINISKKVKEDPALKRQLANPYLICPENCSTVRQKNIHKAQFDDVSLSWAAPFVMAGVNTRVVLRSNYLLNYRYGKEFKYNEAMLTGKGKGGRKRAKMMTFGLAALLIGASMSPTRWLLEKFLLPKPGEGPSPEEQKNGYYQIVFYGKTKHGDSLQAEFTGDRDPGYGSTAKMLAQAAACIAFDVSKEALPGGFYTPSAAMGNQLIDRLTAHSGISLKLLESSDKNASDEQVIHENKETVQED